MNNARTFTHAELVVIAHGWVLNNARCGIAFMELGCHCSNEIPDVIGFGSWGHSVIVECKISRGDFLNDKKKSFRKNPEKGMGTHRYYCCPKDLIKKEELPEGWGLIYVSDKGRARIEYHSCVPDTEFPNSSRLFKHEKHTLAEHDLLYNALRRLHIRGRLGEIYEPMSGFNMSGSEDDILAMKQKEVNSLFGAPVSMEQVKEHLEQQKKKI